MAERPDAGRALPIASPALPWWSRYGPTVTDTGAVKFAPYAVRTV